MAPLAQIEHRGLAIWVLQMWPTLRASEVAGATNHRKTNTSFKKHKFRILSSSLFTSHVQSWDHARRSCTTRAINLAWKKYQDFAIIFGLPSFAPGCIICSRSKIWFYCLSVKPNIFFVGNSAPSIHPWLKFIHTHTILNCGEIPKHKKTGT